MSGYGSIEKSPTNAPAKRMSLLSAAGIATAVVAATALVAVVTMPSPKSMLANVNKDDGSDALINAILVARGDALPTKFAASRLHIDPALPFEGSDAYEGKDDSVRRRSSGLKQQRVQSLAMMPSGFRFLSLDELDPSTQFCADAEDCIRDLDYFKQNAIWHQAAHDMIGDNGPRGPAFPHNVDGVKGKAQYAWCDYDLNPSC
mmetsp:Transcript_994/g.1264  ORF Transcript_994/g.1264 Transcript_994/m.1264 type:complete len:203 (-) Transcript_994:44-652(-)